MSDFWFLESSAAVQAGLTTASVDCGKVPDLLCSILNSEEVFNAGRSRAQVRELPFPVARLKIIPEDFQPDHFDFAGTHLVSERMREAMSLDSSGVRFFDVDSSQCAPAARAKNYQVMEVIAVEDVSDKNRSDYKMEKLLPDLPPRPTCIENIAMRLNARPQHDLFYDEFFMGFLFCTEAFALRVLRAGCTGVLFGELAQVWGPNKLYRTLRGLERIVECDLKRHIDVMELVRPID